MVVKWWDIFRRVLPFSRKAPFSIEHSSNIKYEYEKESILIDIEVISGKILIIVCHETEAHLNCLDFPFTFHKFFQKVLCDFSIIIFGCPFELPSRLEIGLFVEEFLLPLPSPFQWTIFMSRAISFLIQIPWKIEFSLIYWSSQNTNKMLLKWLNNS